MAGGTTINYTITVKNTGNVTLTTLAVNDEPDGSSESGKRGMGGTHASRCDRGERRADDRESCTECEC
ncbi:MAG: hypothetical protein M9950_01545 [Thermomicrobiales bacterium]|nr:hypothetical protein [Thermomicrobiales bacterium]